MLGKKKQLDYIKTIAELEANDLIDGSLNTLIERLVEVKKTIRQINKPI